MLLLVKKQGENIMAKSTFLSDFKKFITKGNVIDMAVGVVVGGSFSKIVTGLVNYIINPFVGIFIKGGSLDSIKTVISEAVLDAEGAVKTAEVAILWGTWLQTILDFLITALCIFIVLRVIMKAKNRLEAKKLEEEKAKAAEAKAASDAAAAALKEKQDRLEASQLNQEKLLSEILEQLKNK
jgi:large conductance mechanosensitive channel